MMVVVSRWVRANRWRLPDRNSAASPSLSSAEPQRKPKHIFKNKEEAFLSLLLNIGSLRVRWPVLEPFTTKMSPRVQAGAQRVVTAGGLPFSYAPALK